MLVNVTQHPIVIRLDDERELILQPSGVHARVTTEQTVVAEADGVPIVATRFSEIRDLPEPKEGVLYVASTLVAQAAARIGRSDVVSPDTGPTAIRDSNGQIVAVRRLQTFVAIE